LLNIDNKASPLPIWCYINKPLYICVTLTNNTDSGKILYQQCIIYQSAKFQSNLSMQTIVTAAFVRSPQNVKHPVLGNRFFNPDSDHGLLGNSAINFLAPYPFSCLNNLIKT